MIQHNINDVPHFLKVAIHVIAKLLLRQFFIYRNSSIKRGTMYPWVNVFDLSDRLYFLSPQLLRKHSKLFNTCL